MHRVCRTFAFAMISEGDSIECTADVTLVARQRLEPPVADPDRAAESMFSPKLAWIIGGFIDQSLNGHVLTIGLCPLVAAENMAEMAYVNVLRLVREVRRQTNWQLHVEAVRITVPGVGWAESSWAVLEP